MTTLQLKLNGHINTFTINIELNIKSQGIIGVFGHSGSGKSTLLRTIAGLENRLHGEITFNGQALLNSNNKLCVKPEQRHIGLVFQNSRLFPHLSVYQNLVFAQKRCQQSQLTIENIIELTELSSLRHKKPQQLSSGEQQRVALARAILAEPQLLLLDEPLSALDQHNKIKLLALLAKVQKQLNIPMLYVSHSLAELQQVAEQLLVLANGEVIDFGDIHQVIHRLNSENYNNQTKLAISRLTINQQTSLALQIKQHDQQHGLTELTLTKQQCLYLPLLDENSHPINSILRCFIFANDISITLHEPNESSIVNHLQGRICEITQQSTHSILLTIECAQQCFYSQISKLSYQKLKLTKNDNIFIQFKASAIQTLADHQHFIKE